MKVVSLYYPDETEKNANPQEDAFAVDAKRGVFAVADGVHLYRGAEYAGEYPHPSPAGSLARKFCSTFVRRARRMNLRRAFSAANYSLAPLNKSRNFFPPRLKVAATASFGRIRGKILEWGLICDSGVAVVGKSGNLKLFAQDRLWLSDFDLSKFDDSAQRFFARTVFRNAISQTGKKTGYGVLTGEKAAEKYARYGKQKLMYGDVVVFFTDGFELFMKNRGFRRVLACFDKKTIERFIDKKTKAGNADLKKEKTMVLAKLR